MVNGTRSLPGICALLLLLLLAACAVRPDTASVGEAEAQTGVADEGLAAGVTEGATGVVSNSQVADANSASAKSVAEARLANSTSHDDAEDYDVDSSVGTQITLEGETVTVSGPGVTVNGRTVTISDAGTYSLGGILTDGQIVVDSQGEGSVWLILNGVEMSNSSTAPLYVANAAETIIVLAENSENRLSDGETYLFANADTDEPNAALFSHDDMTIFGWGSLVVDANYNDGIASKDGLIIAGGDITVNAADDGIRGKDYLIVKDGDIAITAQGDGLKSDEDQDPARGYIALEGGNVDISSGGDAIQAQTDVLISGGSFTLTAGGGAGSGEVDASAKAIRAAVNVVIDSGAIDIDSADDAIHSNNNLIINDGAIVIATGNDGLHADATLELNGGALDITTSHEGIESAVIAINDGEVHIVSSNDGINVAGGNDSPPPGGLNNGPNQDTFAEYTGSNYLYVNGGYVVVNAAGDGIDVNGAIEMADGIVIVNGPTDEEDGALDYDATFTMTGGFLVAAGSAEMAQTPDISSTQNSLLLNLDSTLPGGTLIHIQDSNGNALLSFAPAKAYQSIAFSSPELSEGETYTVFYGGSDSGAASDGLYMGGEYSGGTEYTNFTVSSTVTTLGNGED